MACGTSLTFSSPIVPGGAGADSSEEPQYALSREGLSILAAELRRLATWSCADQAVLHVEAARAEGDELVVSLSITAGQRVCRYLGKSRLDLLSDGEECLEFGVRQPLSRLDAPGRLLLRLSLRKDGRRLVLIRAAAEDPTRFKDFTAPCDPEGGSGGGRRELQDVRDSQPGKGPGSFRHVSIAAGKRSIKQISSSLASRPHMAEMNLEDVEERVRQSFKSFNGRDFGREESLTGLQQVQSIIASSKGKGLANFRQQTAAMDIRKRPHLSSDVFKMVIIQDEWQQRSCLWLPLTMFFFCVFMYLFQQYYGVASMFMAESVIRERLEVPAASAEDFDDVYAWLEQVYFPYLWEMGRGDDELSAVDGSLHQELAGGVLLKSAKSSTVTCEDDAANRLKCHPETSRNSTEDLWFQLMEATIASNELETSSGPVGARRMQHGARHSPARRLKPWLARRPRRRYPHLTTTAAAGATKIGTGAPTTHRPASLGRQHVGAGGRWAALRRQQDLPGTRRKEHCMGSPKARRLKLARTELRTALPNPSANGHTEQLVVPMSLSLQEVRAVIRSMRSARALTRETLFLSLEAVIHNDELERRIATLAIITFRFSRGGGIYVTSSFSSISRNSELKVFVLLCTWITSLVVTTIMAGVSAGRAFGASQFVSHMLRCWNVLDWFLVGYGFVILGVLGIELLGISSFNHEYAQYREDRNRQADDELPVFDATRFKDVLDSMSRTSYVTGLLQIIVADYHVVLLARYVLASRGQPRLAIVVNTLRKAATDLFHLALVSALVFSAFMFSGHILFGRGMEEFATLEGAAAECTYILFSREYEWTRFTAEGVFAGQIWVWSFLVVVVLVLVNVILAMIFGTYNEVRNEVNDQDTVLKTLQGILAKLRQSSNWVPNVQLMRLADGGDETLCVSKLKENFPNIPHAQVKHLFVDAKQRLELVIVRGNRNAWPESMAGLLSGIDQLRRAIGLMSLPVGREAFPDRGSGFESLPSVPPRLRSPFGDEDLSISSGTPIGPPDWVTGRLLPHLARREDSLSSAFNQIKEVELRLAERGLLHDMDMSLPSFEPALFHGEGDLAHDVRLPWSASANGWCCV